MSNGLYCQLSDVAVRGLTFSYCCHWSCCIQGAPNRELFILFWSLQGVILEAINHPNSTASQQHRFALLVIVPPVYWPRIGSTNLALFIQISPLGSLSNTDTLIVESCTVPLMYFQGGSPVSPLVFPRSVCFLCSSVDNLTSC